jgi:Fic family protein
MSNTTPPVPALRMPGLRSCIRSRTVTAEWVVRYSISFLAQDEQRLDAAVQLVRTLMDVRDEYYAALQRSSSGERIYRRSGADKATVRMQQSRTEVNERELKALGRMPDTLAQEFVGGMTNKKYAYLTSASPATAQRDLADLVSKGYLVLRGAGRSARYELAGVEKSGIAGAG